jgi:hypothetical protein
MRPFWALALVLLPLPGCFPPAVTIASFAADGASYAATGKTVSDHGICVATARDCALIGSIVDGKPLCVDRAPDLSVPVEDRRRARLFFVAGSYSDPANAERAARRLSFYGVAVVPVTVDGRLLHRVVVGPLSPVQAAALGPDTWKAPR